MCINVTWLRMVGIFGNQSIAWLRAILSAGAKSAHSTYKMYNAF
ncbi:MAG: hypothetical protein ACR5KW_03220 [Wolbachia sp.]